MVVTRDGTMRSLMHYPKISRYSDILRYSNSVIIKKISYKTDQFLSCCSSVHPIIAMHCDTRYINTLKVVSIPVSLSCIMR